VLFHVIASGRCWVALPGGERYWASAGEVIVLPYGDEFLMGGVEAATPVHITSVVRIRTGRIVRQSTVSQINKAP
jgi:quercetin dioxygenase-like cupin family protein